MPDAVFDFHRLTGRPQPAAIQFRQIAGVEVNAEAMP